MKIIIALIKPSLTETIAEALAGIGIVGATATESKEFGPGEFRPISYRGAESEQPYSRETQLEIIAQDDRVEDAVELIKTISKQNEINEVKIIIKNMDDSVRIRDGHHGDHTL